MRWKVSLTFYIYCVFTEYTFGETLVYMCIFFINHDTHQKTKGREFSPSFHLIMELKIDAIWITLYILHTRDIKTKKQRRKYFYRRKYVYSFIKSAAYISFRSTSRGLVDLFILNKCNLLKIPDKAFVHVKLNWISFSSVIFFYCYVF